MNGRDSALRAVRAALDRGDTQEAEAQCRAAIAAQPRDARAWTLLGTVLRKTDPATAETALLRALELDSAGADAAFHLGNLYREQQRFADAINAYQRALRRAPDHSSVLNNLALAREGAGDTDAALDGYRTVLRRDPDHRQALGNLVHLLCRLRRWPEAETDAALYLSKFPDGDARFWVDYGICQHHRGANVAAERSFRRALAFGPNDPVALTNLGSLLIERDDFEHADTILTNAVARGSDFAYALSLLAYCRANVCSWSELDALQHRVQRCIIDGDDAINAFAALSLPLDASEQLRVARRWAADVTPPAELLVETAADPAAMSPVNPSLKPAVSAAPPRARAPGQRLRLGYVSSDFRTHPTAFLLTEVWERHDRRRVETFGYSIGPGEVSPVRARIEAAFDHFRDCQNDDIEQTVRRIRADDVDLLIDLNGYTTHARSEIFAAKAARVQLQWLGHLGTLGLPQIDYVLTDRVATPPDQQAFFSERLLYLPDCYCPSDTRRSVAITHPTRATSGLPERAFVFCCFNREYKIQPPVFAAWMRLLASIQDSVLWLSPARASAADNLRREARAHGIDSARLVFAPRVSLAEHLARSVLADLFLDTSPYNAGATANDALFMGVPLLTQVGSTMAGRVAASQLQAIGLDDLVTPNLAAYESRARALATDPRALAEVRARLAANRAVFPLFDMQRFTRNLEDVLESVAI